MADVLVQPAFQSVFPDSGDATKFGPAAWNAPRLFGAGSRGDQLVRQTTSATGAAWLAPESIDARIYGAVGDGVADDTVGIQAAYAAIPATGGRVVLPPRSSGPTTYRFNQTLAITGKTVVVDGLTATTDNAGPHGAVTLEWFGGATPAITISGTAASGSKLSGFRLNNTGTATVGIDIDGVGMPAVSEVALAAPTVPFSVAGVRIGNTANTTNLHFDRLVVQAAAPIGVQILRLGAHAVFTKCTLIANTVNNVVLGSATTSALSVHFLGCSFDIATNLDAVSIIYAQNVTFTDSYFEFGGTGYAVRIPSTAQVASGIDIKGTWFTCNVGSSATAAIRSDFAATIAKVSGCFVTGLANPGYAFQNGGCQSFFIAGCHLNTAGSAIADVLTNVTALANVYGGSATPQSDLGTLGSLALTKSQNAGTPFAVTNTHAGTGAFAQTASVALGSSLNQYAFGTGYTTSGRFLQGSGLIDADGVGGLGIAASHGSGIIRFYTNGSVEQMRLDAVGRLGIGVTPSAVVHIKAGTATANTAPVKLTSGPLLSAPEVGAIEFLTDKVYATITTGAARKTFAFLESPVFTGNVTAGADFVGNSAGGIFPSGASKSYLWSPANAQLNLANAILNAGVGLDFATDTVLKLRTRAQSAYATLDCLGLKASGVAGVSFGPAAPASITIVNGIVTACS